MSEQWSDSMNPEQWAAELKNCPVCNHKGRMFIEQAVRLGRTPKEVLLDIAGISIRQLVRHAQYHMTLMA